MSTSIGTGNRRKQKHSSLWMNMDDFSTMSLQSGTSSGGSSSSSPSSSSDMTLPTPPRSPNASVGFEDAMEYEDEDDYASGGIPEPLLDDLLELWCEEADYNASAEEPEEISFKNALSELGFDTDNMDDENVDQNDTMSESEHAENMIDHLLANCNGSYLSPPPTNPSSPKMQTDCEFEESYTLSAVKSEMPDSIQSVGEEVEEEIITNEEGEDVVDAGAPLVDMCSFQVKMERPDEPAPIEEPLFPTGQQEEVIQNLIDCSEQLNFEIDEQLLAKFDDPLQAVGDASISAAKSVEKFLDVLKSEPADIVSSTDDYDLFGEPRMKKGRFDFEDDFLNEFPDIKQDCMWNGFLGGDTNLSPSALLGSSSWKQEYTFETLFDEKDKLEVTASGAVISAEDKLKAAQKEAEDAAKAAIAAEEARKKREMEEFRMAFDNDHRYALPYEDKQKDKETSGKSKTASAQARKVNKVIQGIIVKSEPQDGKSGGSATGKKTKILVPLKDLMETLQQKSFLVSPLGPNKKIIRFTGSDSVKGVLSTASFQSAAIVAGQSSSGRTIATAQSKPNHNVRKRPHKTSSPKIEITSALSSDDILLDSSSPLISSAIVSSSTGSSSPHSSSSSSSSTSHNNNSSSNGSSTKKKTKTHNNMERMRRIDLRNSFDNLKKLVPPLSKIPKCSKVEILRRAEEYIKGLRNQEKRLQKEEAAVRQRNAQLRARLESTSSSLNMSTNPLSSSSLLGF